MFDSASRCIEPTRIADARIARKLSRVGVAEAINVTPSYYADIESGNRSAVKYIHLLSECLNFPIDFFYGQALPALSSESFSYRKRNSMSLSDRNSAERLGKIAAGNLGQVFQSYVRLPEVNIPDLSPLTCMSNPVEFAEASSELVRSFFQMGYGPLRNAIDLAESMGVLVFWIDGPNNFDGVSFWADSRPYVVLNRNVRDGYRARFTVLHELLHICAHKELPETGKSEDRQADAFASALLMPSSIFSKAFPGTSRIHSLLEQRRIWGASVAAQVRRAYDLKMISEWMYRDAFIKMNMHWKRIEPNPMTPESSSVHAFVLDEAGDKGRFSEDLADEARLSYLDFLTFMPLASEYERRKFVQELV